MKTLYLDCSMGASGDMLTAALLSLHREPEDFLRRINAALAGVAELSATQVKKCGIQGLSVKVSIGGAVEGEAQAPCRVLHHRGIDEIYRIIDGMDLPDRVREDARQVYDLVAGAESRVHGCEMEEIHFHELGSLDALADVLAVSLLLYELSPEWICASPVHVGSGTVKCAHGVLPVPAPATELLLHGIPAYSGEISGELCTPTGAALLKYYVNQFGSMPVIRTEHSGYGAGKKDFERPNLLRAVMGESEAGGERVLELCCNLDDMSPEGLAFAQEQLLMLGAPDVWTTNIGMKKGRAAVMLSCLCREEQREEMLRCIFKNTSTLGVREREYRRYTLSRSIHTRETDYGPVRVKTAEGWGVRREKCEYEDLAEIARKTGLSLEQLQMFIK